MRRVYSSIKNRMENLPCLSSRMGDDTATAIMVDKTDRKTAETAFNATMSSDGGVL